MRMYPTQHRSISEGYRSYRITVSRLPGSPRRYLAESGGCSGEGSSSAIAIRRLREDMRHHGMLEREERMVSRMCDPETWHLTP